MRLYVPLTPLRYVCSTPTAADRGVLTVPQDGTEGESRAADEPGAAFIAPRR